MPYSTPLGTNCGTQGLADAIILLFCYFAEKEPRTSPFEKILTRGQATSQPLFSCESILLSSHLEFRRCLTPALGKARLKIMTLAKVAPFAVEQVSSQTSFSRAWSSVVLHFIAKTFRIANRFSHELLAGSSIVLLNSMLPLQFSL